MNDFIKPSDIMITIKEIQLDDGDTIPIGTKGEIVKRFINTILGDDVYIVKINGTNVIAEYGVDIQLNVNNIPLEITQHLCRDCHQPTRTETQELFHKPSVTIHTCDNYTCSLWGVTLSTDQYAKLTDAEWDSYRQSVANFKKSLEKLGG